MPIGNLQLCDYLTELVQISPKRGSPQVHRAYLGYLVLPSETGLVFAAVQRKELSETGPGLSHWAH